MHHLDLSYLVPGQAFADRYISREIAGMTDVEILTTSIKKGKNVLLMGPTGPGKTSLFLAVCAKEGWPLGTANMNGQTSVEDLVGQIVPRGSSEAGIEVLQAELIDAKEASLAARDQGDRPAFIACQRKVWEAEAKLERAYRMSQGDLVWVDGLLVRLMKGDPRFEHTCFLADEINFSPAKVMAILNGVTDDRKSITIVQHMGEVVRANKGFHFGAAMNPNYEGTRNLNKAFKDRFQVQLHFDYEPKIELELVKNDRLVNLVQHLREMEKKGEIQTPVSTRTMIHFMELVEIFNTDVAIECFVAHFEEEEQLSVRQAAELKLGGGRGGRIRTPKTQESDI